jgi:hypothetical protein
VVYRVCWCFTGWLEDQTWLCSARTSCVTTHDEEIALPSGVGFSGAGSGSCTKACTKLKTISHQQTPWLQRKTGKDAFKVHVLVRARQRSFEAHLAASAAEICEPVRGVGTHSTARHDEHARCFYGFGSDFLGEEDDMD